MHATLPLPTEATTRLPGRLPVTPPVRARQVLHNRPVLVALDDGLASLAAARVGAALARDRGARPAALRAVSPPPVGMSAGQFGFPLATPAETSEVRWVAEALAMRAYLRRALEGPVDWPIHVDPGPAGVAIAERARQIGAALTVLGLRRRHGLARVFHDATVLAVVRDSDVPVLAVTTPTIGLPRRIVVGVDFGRAGLYAARAALAVLAEGGSLVLAYAAPHVPTTVGAAGEGERVIHAEGVAAAFVRLRMEVNAPPDVRVETVELAGDPASQLLALAERTDAECIAVGSRRHGALDRWLVGSVTTDLARAGECSLLIVPPRRDQTIRRDDPCTPIRSG